MVATVGTITTLHITCFKLTAPGAFLSREKAHKVGELVKASKGGHSLHCVTHSCQAPFVLVCTYLRLCNMVAEIGGKLYGFAREILNARVVLPKLSHKN